MKRTIKSFRWKNFFSINAWKKCDFATLFINLIGLITVLYTFLGIKYSMLANNDFTTNTLLIVCGIILVIFAVLLAIELIKACTADDFFQVYIEGEPAKCYIDKINKKHEYNKYFMTIKKGKQIILETPIDEYQCINKKGDLTNLLYTRHPGTSWIYIHKSGITTIGRKLEENVFLMPRTREIMEKITLCFLHKDGFYTTEVDYYVNSSNLYIPQDVRYKVKVKSTPLLENVAHLLTKRPDSCVLTKNNGKYCYIGIYKQTKEQPFPLVQEVIVQNSIFLEGLDTIILSYNDHKKSYDILHKKEADSKLVNEYVIIEKIKDYEIGGRILIFNPRTKALVNIYEGKFFGYSEDLCHIIGNDNHFHNP